jgi:diketogulonate reductase-like aldo/keto reductase
VAYDEGEAFVRGEIHGFVVEGELADERVVDAFGAGAVAVDFVLGPALAERVAAGGQFADQVGQGLVVGVAADFGAQGGDVLVGDGVPVGVELGGGRLGYDQTLHAFDKSAGKLGVEQIDLFILHQALPSRFDLTQDAYRALEKLLADGKVRAIGVSNFMPEHLDALLEQATVVPTVNQVEIHPYFAQPTVQATDSEHGILTQAWSPIGGITSYRGTGDGTSTFDDPTITRIAAAHGKTPAQVMIRWHLQEGRSAIPKSVRAERIAENFDVFDFELTTDELATLDKLDTGVRGGPEPEDITLENFGREIPEA